MWEALRRREERILTSRKFGKNTGLHKYQPTIPTGDEFHKFSGREAQINYCDNIDSGESIDNEDSIDTKY
jgi:hypothetical protein